MSLHGDIMAASGLPVIKDVHGADQNGTQLTLTITRPSDQATQTVQCWDPRGEYLGAVDPKVERLVCVESSDLDWSVEGGYYLSISDDSDEYQAMKVSVQSDGTTRIQGYKPEVNT